MRSATYDNNENLHSYDDQPAHESWSGTLSWYKHGELHRENGPAEICGRYSLWYYNGKKHRFDGPAVEWIDGHKEWYVHGKRHRLDGPATIDFEGARLWYINDVNITNEIHQMAHDMDINLDRLSEDDIVYIMTRFL